MSGMTEGERKAGMTASGYFHANDKGTIRDDQVAGVVQGQDRGGASLSAHSVAGS